MKHSISEQEFMDIKKSVLEREAARKTVPLNQIKVTEDSFKDRTIEVSGNRLNVSDDFFGKLSVLLKINKSLTSEMMRNSDAKLAANMMSGLKSYRESKDGGLEVMLIADPNTRTIVDICKPTQYKKISNASAFDLAERVLNDNSGLSIESINFGANSGVINFLNDKEIGFANAGKDEYFKFGFSIMQTNRNTAVEMYNQRLVCTNGLRTSLGAGAIGGNRALNFSESFMLNGVTPSDIFNFMQNISGMAGADFIPHSFNEVLETAVNTKASLLEVETALLATQYMIEERDVDLRNRYMQQLAKNYFQGHSMTAQRLARKGVELMDLSDRQKQLIKTPQSIWDVVNSMTFLGSNNSGLPIANQHQLKEKAGVLFSKGIKTGYDLQYADYMEL